MSSESSKTVKNDNNDNNSSSTSICTRTDNGRGSNAPSSSGRRERSAMNATDERRGGHGFLGREVIRVWRDERSISDNGQDSRQERPVQSSVATGSRNAAANVEADYANVEEEDEGVGDV